MDITKLIAKIKATVSEEDLGQINSVLREIENGANELIDDIKSVSRESKNRKLEIRELKSQLEDKGIDKDSYEQKLNDKDAEIERLKGVETQFNAVQEKRDAEVMRQWEMKSKVFEIEETDTNYKHITGLKDSYHFGDDLTVDQVRENIKTYELQEKAGGFKNIETKVEDGSPPEHTKQTKVDDPYAAFSN